MRNLSANSRASETPYYMLKQAELATYRGAWTAMTLLPIRLWHWGHLQNRHQRQTHENDAYMNTNMRLSVTFTLLACNEANFLDTCSFRALLTSIITLVSNCGVRSDSNRNSLTSRAVTKGGRSLSVSVEPRRAECRLMRSRAGRSRSRSDLTVGRRYKRRRVR